MECEGQQRLDRYGIPGVNNADGIHLRGKYAIGDMTRTFIYMLTDVYPHLKNPRKPAQNPSQYPRQSSKDNFRSYSEQLQNRVHSGKF